MITDTLKNTQQYYILGEKFKKGFEFILNNDLNSLKDGRYDIDGDKIYANVQSLVTKQKENKKWEAHRKYIDIQYLIKGSECMGYGILENFNTTITPYNEAKDIEFLDGNIFNYINVREGNFVIFYPNDVHAPMLSCDKDINIKKVIVKIAVD